jgi:hypothetical protein
MEAITIEQMSVLSDILNSVAGSLVTRLNSILYRLQLNYSAIRGWVLRALRKLCCRYKGLATNHTGVVTIKL